MEHDSELRQQIYNKNRKDFRQVLYNELGTGLPGDVKSIIEAELGYALEPILGRILGKRRRILEKIIEERKGKETSIPARCWGCLWIKDNKCRHEGEFYDNFLEDIEEIDEETGLMGCHSIVEGIEEVDWSKYDSN